MDLFIILSVLSKAKLGRLVYNGFTVQAKRLIRITE